MFTVLVYIFTGDWSSAQENVGVNDNPLDILGQERQIAHYVKQNPNLEALVKTSEKQIYHPSPVLEKFLLPKPTVVTTEGSASSWDIRQRYGMELQINVSWKT